MLVVGLILLIMHLSVKQSRVQQQQYAEAFKLLAQNQSQTNRLMLGGITDLYGGDGLKSAGSSRWGVDALPEPEQTPEEKEEMRELAAKCEDLGAKIDQVTGRKNNSKNVSELVYKIAMRLGLSQNTAMVYFCASMVYDAGFMGVSEEVLTAESLTEEQHKELEKHVNLAEEYLQFVPKRYWDIFEDASKYHHENMDGSGKPKGLKGDNIPEIARIIRVADSFIALSSKRSYRGGIDKDTAIEKLEEQSHIYDPDVIAVLKDII
jgi:HD-GYP domain-containing protein (c-di-GMP phosphodiesterase class II)